MEGPTTRLLYCQEQRASLNVCLTILTPKGFHLAVPVHTTQTLYALTEILSSRRKLRKPPSSQPVAADNGRSVAASAQ